jgi:3D (Asp-Asp-Asp) domain-containing protein
VKGFAWAQPRKLSLALAPFNAYSARVLRLRVFPRFILCSIAAVLLASCATQQTARTSAAKKMRRINVRTTAYCSREPGGPRNAVGEYLSGRIVRSAASDWSRFPLGTRFKIVSTNEEYVIDDYGTALVGTNTIDLYKSSRLEMRQWGVRHVDIDILQWGSDEQSMKVLGPRAKHSTVRRMLVALEKKRSQQDDRRL